MAEYVTAEEHHHFPAFKEFANANGIELEYKDDWFAWWECFLAGANAEWKKMEKEIKGE